MLKGVGNSKVKSLTAIVLLTMMLISMMTMSAKSSPGIWLEYDRNDPDVGHSGADALAVRFTPPIVWLAPGRILRLFEIVTIQVFIACDSWNAGFDIYVTNGNHETIHELRLQKPTTAVNGWYTIDLRGWTGFVDDHFHVEYLPLVPNAALQETWCMLMFDEAVADEGETSFGRSYINTYGPDDPNLKSWYPIEMIYPYGSGDLLIRVELEPQTPVSILPALTDQILEADNTFFDGFENKLAPKMKRVLIEKINEAMFMFEMGDYQGALDKLVHDIGPKLADPRPTPLADPRPTPATSWLHLYPEGSSSQKLVSSFAQECVNTLQMTKSAIPEPLPSFRDYADFDGDGNDDLVIGVPHENIGGKTDAGAVNVLFGDPYRLSAVRDQYWHQDITGVEGNCGQYDTFGESLAIGDFDSDGCSDLAVGVPGDEVDGIEHAGAVNVLYGWYYDALSVWNNQLWHQNVPEVLGACEEGDYFGAALATGDFNQDDYDDLAIGVFAEDVDSIDNAGAVNILYGSSNGLSATGNQLWSQDTTDIQGVCEEDDFFGTALIAGDFDGDGCDDLAIGVPNEGIGEITDAGAVNVIFGSSAGLAATGNQLWSQDEPDVQGVCEQFDYFGGTLAAGDFNLDGYDDLAIGVPFEDVDGENDAGATNVLYGSYVGLSAAIDQLLYQGFLPGECEQGDKFGAALTVGDFNRDGYDDLAVGVPYEDFYYLDEFYKSDAGAVNIVYGSSMGLLSGNYQLWFQQDLWPLGPVDAQSSDDERFGKSLAVGDFNGDDCCDLAIGVPSETVYVEKYNGYWPVANAGTVNVLYGKDTGLSEDNCQLWNQSVPDVEGTCEEDDFFGDSLPCSHWY